MTQFARTRQEIKKSSVHRSMYCTRGFVIKLVRPIGERKKSERKFSSQVPRGPRPKCSAIVRGSRGYNWGALERLEQLTWSAVYFRSQNRDSSTLFFCYDLLGRARGGEPHAPQLFSKPPATSGAHFFLMGTRLLERFCHSRARNNVFSLILPLTTAGGGVSKGLFLISKRLGTIGAHFSLLGPFQSKVIGD